MVAVFSLMDAEFNMIFADGAVFANLFFLPMADKMGNKTTATSMSAALLVEAARLIHQRKHPLIVREKLNSFIPPGEWKTE